MGRVSPAKAVPYSVRRAVPRNTNDGTTSGVVCVSRPLLGKVTDETRRETGTAWHVKIRRLGLGE